MAGRWYAFGPPEQEFATWTNLLAAYGDWQLVATSDQAWPAGWKNAGWDESTRPPGAPACTATGKCLNVAVGARKTRTDIFGERALTWKNFYQGFKGHLDRFTLGIDGHEVTYDFEPSASALVLPDLRLANPEAYTFPERQTAPAQRYRLVEVTGKCVDRNAAVGHIRGRHPAPSIAYRLPRSRGGRHGSEKHQTARGSDERRRTGESGTGPAPAGQTRCTRRATASSASKVATSQLQAIVDAMKAANP